MSTRCVHAKENATDYQASFYTRQRNAGIAEPGVRPGARPCAPRVGRASSRRMPNDTPLAAVRSRKHPVSVLAKTTQPIAWPLESQSVAVD